MENEKLEQRLQDEILNFVAERRSLHLATVNSDGTPLASYAPFAADRHGFWVVLSDIAVHGANLLNEPRASILLVEDETEAEELFARRRVNYQVEARAPEPASEDWQNGVALLEARLGKMPRMLSELEDFRVFRLRPVSGRYVKGFGAAYSLAGGELGKEALQHLTDGHRGRRNATLDSTAEATD